MAGKGKFGMLRINSIRFHNFRNILDSEIRLNTKELQTSIGGVVAGIYGANGSSKSSVGYALCLLVHLITGISPAFFHHFVNDFGICDNEMWIEYDLSVDAKDSSYNGVFIRFDFKKDGDVMYLSSETVTLKTNSKGRPSSYVVRRGKNELDFLVNDNDLNRLIELFGVDKESLYSMIISATKDNRSLLLGLKINTFVTKYLKTNNKNTSQQYLFICELISWIVQNISISMPDSYGVSLTNSLFVCYSGDEYPIIALTTESDGSVVANKNQIERVEKVIDVSKRFMRKIVSDFDIKLERTLVETTADGEEKYRVKLFSVKKDGSFPFENESEGIKRLFYIGAAISKCMNDPDYVVFIDEFDEGIFEVLYGEAISGLYKQCMGQFIFTSHNLRPLEVMKYTNFIFSTLNPSNRFVTIKGIKPGNNLRDIYIRKIMYGDGEMLSNSIDANDLLEGLIDGAD